MKKFLLLCVSIFLTPVFASAATTISSNITSNQTWTTASSTFIIASDISIASGVTLTINPGVVVKFNGTSITVNGTLNAPGSATSTTYFTSYHDDTIGGDTNGNSTATAGAVGQWGGIITNPGASTTLAYAQVRYGGNSFFSSFKNAGGIVTLANTTFATTGASWAPAFDHKLGTTTITSCTFQNGYYGIYVENTSPTAGVLTIASSTFSTGNYGIYSAGVTTLSIASSTFTQYSNYGLYTERNPILSLTNSSFATNTVGAVTFTNGNPTSFTHSANKAWGNGMNGILIANPYIGVNQTWFGDTIPYVISGTLNVSAGYTLTIATSSVLKFNSGTVSVSGTLKVSSATATPVYFTSYKDDILNDTNNDNASTTPAAGNWQNIAINGGGVAEFTGAVIRYAGSGGSAAVANSGTVTLANSEVASSSSSGIAANAGTLSVSSSTIHDNTNYGMLFQGGTANINLSTFKNNSVYGIQSSSGVGSLIVFNSTFINSRSGAMALNLWYNLTFTHYNNIATGTGKGGVLLYGTTGNAQTWYGDPKLPYIVSTTTGDVILSKTVTVGAGAVFKFEGPTARIYVGNGGAFHADSAASSSKIYLTSIKDDTVGGDTNGNGSATTPGAGDWDGLRVESGASSTLKYASVRYGGNTVTGSSKMVWNNGGIVSIENTEIATSSSYGVFTNSGTTAVTLSGLHGNTYGACVTGGVFSIRSSQLYLNSGYGVCNTTGVDMHGEYNYWGASDGPSGQGPGTGDAVSINVLFTNWLAIPHFLHLSTSSGQLVSSVNVFDNIDWHFLGTTTSYTAAWYGAVDTWNNEGPIEIATSTYWWTADVVIEDIATSSSDLFVAQYRPQSITPDEIVFNPYFMNQYNSLPAMQQNAATHELGHALGLGHSYLGNIMNLYDTTQTTLGDQDKSDYHYWWGY